MIIWQCGFCFWSCSTPRRKLYKIFKRARECGAYTLSLSPRHFESSPKTLVPLLPFSTLFFLLANNNNVTFFHNDPRTFQSFEFIRVRENRGKIDDVNRCIKAWSTIVCLLYHSNPLTYCTCIRVTLTQVDYFFSLIISYPLFPFFYCRVPAHKVDSPFSG